MTQPIQQTAPSPRRALRDWIDSDEFRFQIQRSMPEGMRADRFVRILATATIRNPKILQCTRESFFKCVLDLSAMGLEPDGRRAHLIPFKDTCTLIIDYKGIAELVRRHGDVSTIHCDVVGRKDQFVCRYGTGGKLEHVPAIEDRGEIYAVYSYVKLKDGAEEWEVMSAAEVEKVRDRSRAAKDGPWVTDWPEMAKKTVFRRHSKTLPLSPATRTAVEYGEDEEFTRFAAAVPARAPKTTMVDGLEPAEPPEDTKPAPPPSEPVKEAARAAKEAMTAPVEPKKEPKPKPQSKSDQLLVLLKEAGIDWALYAQWIASVTADGVPAAPRDLPPSILADCVVNFDANKGAFASWKDQKEDQVP